MNLFALLRSTAATIDTQAEDIIELTDAEAAAFTLSRHVCSGCENHRSCGKHQDLLQPSNHGSISS